MHEDASPLGADQSDEELLVASVELKRQVRKLRLRLGEDVAGLESWTLPSPCPPNPAEA